MSSPWSVPIRLLMQGPYPDESMSSLVDRACALYQVTRYSLIFTLLDRAGYLVSPLPDRDLDDPDMDLRDAIADALQVTTSTLTQHAISDGPAWLAPSRRNNYCPLCFQADLHEDRSPYFRRSWGRVAVTICPKHHCPLYPWPRQARGSDGRQLPFAWQVPAAERPSKPARSKRDLRYYPMGLPEREVSAVATPAAENLTNHLLAFEKSLDRELDTHGAPLESSDPGFQLRGRLITALAVVTRTSPCLNPSLGALRVVNGRWSMFQDTDYGDSLGYLPLKPWEAFRRVGSASRRRAALAMAAATVEPGWPADQFVVYQGRNKPGTPGWWHFVVMPYQHEELLPEFESIRQALGIPPPPARRARRRIGLWPGKSARVARHSKSRVRA